MRAFALGVAVLVAALGVAAGCGESDGAGGNGDNTAGGAGASALGGAGGASSGNGGVAVAGSSSGALHGGASGSSSAGSSSAGAAGAALGGSDQGQAGAPSGGGASGLSECNPKQVVCKRRPPDCPAMQVPSVEGTCWGECVKIEECGCSVADDCPDTNQYTCWRQQHCGPFVT